MNMWIDGPGFGFGEFLMVIILAAFVALVVAVLIAAFRWLWRTADQAGSREAPRAPAVHPDDPLEILRRRYARGDIDDEEYERRRRLLGGG